ncbi:universal stress protein [Nocardia sp. NPDC051750]|uniref:universal stress protein n=1 Tax=Nocardia sp. NPDC051750 TaxID=3364325 RepID=UPI00379086AB
MPSDDNANTAAGQPILAAADGSTSAYRAVAWASAEAVLRGCALHIITSMGIPGGFDPDTAPAPADRRRLGYEGEQILAEAVRTARLVSPGPEPLVTTELTFELIAPVLIARSVHTQMLVVGSRGMGAFQRGVLGSVSYAATHHAHCPVAVVHTLSALDPISVTKPVVVGVDGSENSRPATALAFSEAARRKVELVAVHGWTDISSLGISVEGWEEPARAVLTRSLAEYQERYPDVRVRPVVTVYRPVRSLLDESEDAQLLVVGSHGRGGFSSMVLGSTSNTLLHTVEVPMIVVRSAHRG